MGRWHWLGGTDPGSIPDSVLAARLPPDAPSLALRRIENMKEKYGVLFVYPESYLPYQEGTCMFIETMSAYVCLRCGAPGELRDTR